MEPLPTGVVGKGDKLGELLGRRIQRQDKGEGADKTNARSHIDRDCIGDAGSGNVSWARDFATVAAAAGCIALGQNVQLDGQDVSPGKRMRKRGWPSSRLRATMFPVISRNVDPSLSFPGNSRSDSYLIAGLSTLILIAQRFSDASQGVCDFSGGGGVQRAQNSDADWISGASASFLDRAEF